MSREEIDLSVVVLADERSSLLTITLAHLEVQSYPSARFEVLIVDAGGTPSSLDLLERHAAGAPMRVRLLRDDGAGASRAPSRSPLPPCISRPRNRAVREASGRWVLFLEELLAEPQLVENHVRAQEVHGGNCAIRGRSAVHPQIAAATFPPWCDPSRWERLLPNQPLRFIDWRAKNLSLPRERVLEAGGFDEGYACSGLDDIELSWRLEEMGVAGFYFPEACAYSWIAAGLELMRIRSYADGYTLSRLLKRTQSDLIRERCLPPAGIGQFLTNRLTGPLAPSMCAFLAKTGGVPWRFVILVLRQAILRGYRDAQAGRPPSPPL